MSGLEICAAVLLVPSPRRLAPYPQLQHASKIKWPPKFLTDNFVSARKLKSRILSERALNSFLALDIREYYERMKRLGESRTRVHARDSLIFL